MKKLFLIVLGCTVALLVGYAGYLSYSKAKETRLMGMARGFAAQSDTRNTVLSLSKVLRIDPHNVEAVRLMGDMAEANHQGDVLAWRKRAVQLAPHSQTDLIALASAALTVHDFALATNALGQVTPAYQNTALYQNAAGALAIAERDPIMAEKYFRQASSLDPENMVPQLNYAVLRLHSTNLVSVAEARVALTKIADGTNQAFRSQALRELTGDAFIHGQLNAAQRLAQRLLAETNSVFADRILQLQILQRIGGADFASALKASQAAAANVPGQIFTLAHWEIKNVSPAETLDWLKNFPPAQQTNQPVAMLAAECRVLTGDWAGLDKTLKHQYWGKLDFIRHAFAARAASGLQLSDGKDAEWGKTLETAGTGMDNLTALFSLARQWNWPNQEEQLLWIIVRHYPNEKWAAQALAESLMSGGNTQSLMQLCSLQLSHNPTNIQTMNNLAMTALLLNAQEKNPYHLAQEVYQAQPTNISCASTYAFALYLQHKSPAALKVFEQFNRQQLEDPSIAGYYGIVLQATGHAAQAPKYLKIASQSHLLPEEKKLFAGFR